MARVSLSWALILGLLSGIGPLCTDFYLPALPEITQQLQATSTQTQLSLTAALIGLGMGQLFFGPLSARIGRLEPLALALLLFIFSSAMCAGAVPGAGRLRYHRLRLANSLLDDGRHWRRAAGDEPGDPAGNAPGHSGACQPPTARPAGAEKSPLSALLPDPGLYDGRAVLLHRLFFLRDAERIRHERHAVQSAVRSERYRADHRRDDLFPSGAPL
ncbi:MFS transporter [Mycobacterium tuberculosis]|nr:MFS transporter [Mycobacterium tuberculosis]